MAVAIVMVIIITIAISVMMIVLIVRIVVRAFSKQPPQQAAVSLNLQACQENLFRNEMARIPLIPSHLGGCLICHAV